MSQRLPNFAPAIRGVPRQQGSGMNNKMNALRRMARNTGAGGAVDFVPGSSCSPNWNQPPIETNQDGCPTSWNGCGDYVFAKFTLPGAVGGVPSVTTGLITAPFSMVAREAICSAVEIDPETGDRTPIGEGLVFLNQAKTANSGTSVFGTDAQSGVDISFFFRNSFFSRLVNFPIYANQPAGERILVNFSANVVEVDWTEIGQSAHMLPGYAD